MDTPGLKRENRSRYVARFGSVVVALLVCLGIFLLPLRASGSEVPSALAMVKLPSLDLATNGNPHPLEEIYLVAPAEETEGAHKSPLKAELLTMLLLALCSGLSVGWLLRNAQRQGAFCSLAGVRWWFATICEDLPFLGVFRL